MKYKNNINCHFYPTFYYKKLIHHICLFIEKIKIISLSNKNFDYIIFNTPLHGNLGDHAITIVERKIINSINCVEIPVNFVKNINLYKKIVELPSVKKLLITGGGNLGSLWLTEETNFRFILKYFSNKEIIVFPQTIYFDMNNEKDLLFYEESRDIYSAHPNLLMFIRDKKSYDFMTVFFPKVKCALVPDSVLFLQYNHLEVMRSGIIFCLRKDKEQSIDTPLIYQYISLFKKRYPSETIKFLDTVLTNSFVNQCNRVKMVNQILDKFSKSKLVFTDRLHGMLFAAITNTPCIAINNRSGKVESVYKWISHLPYIKYIDSFNDIIPIINHLNLNLEYKFDSDVFIDYLEIITSSIKK